MFEDSRVVDPASVFPALAAAIAAVPVRPSRGGLGAANAATTETRALFALTRQLEARLLGRVAAIDAQGLGAGDGFASTASWIRNYANLDHRDALTVVKAARTTETLPLLAQQLDEGRIGVQHLTAVRVGAPRLPDEALAEHDQTLADLAISAHPQEVRRAARLLQHHDDAGKAESDIDHVADSRNLTLAPTFGGAYFLQGLLTAEAGASLATALDSLTTPRGVEDTRTAGQRRHDALLELTGVALASGALPDSGGDRPRLTFLIKAPPGAPGRAELLSLGHAEAGSRDALRQQASDLLEGLLHQLEVSTQEGSTHAGPLIPAQRLDLPSKPTRPGAAAHDLVITGFGVGDHVLIGADTSVPLSVLQRWCCDADVSVAHVDSWGEPLNLERTTRLANVHQRRALTIRDQGCVFPGCDQPPAHCQAHHLRYWSRNGTTNLDNLALVCWFHHHVVHEKHWTLQRLPGDADTPPEWLATAPDGHQLRWQGQRRQPVP